MWRREGERRAIGLELVQGPDHWRSLKKYFSETKSKEFWPDTIVCNLDTWTELDLACVGCSGLVLLCSGLALALSLDAALRVWSDIYC